MPTQGKLRAQFIVSLQIPIGATREDVRAYVAEALGAWCGSLDPGIEGDHPGDPMFYLDPDTIIVRDKS